MHKKLADMIDALIKRVYVTYKCYEMYAHRGKIVQLLDLTSLFPYATDLTSDR
jgi:hypothetical protein